MAKQKLSGWFVAMALVLLIGSVVFPHHHHGNLLCFNSKCMESCCHHHEDGEECEGIASHHHNHASDEIVLHAPYTLAEHPRIISETAADYHALFAMADSDAASSLRVAPPVATTVLLASDSGVPLPKTPFTLLPNRRGPPAA